MLPALPKLSGEIVPEVAVTPSEQEFGGSANPSWEDANFTVRVEIHDALGLYGFDIQLGWSTEWIRYLDHETTIPAEAYSYGVLHSPIVYVKNDVDETASLAGSMPGTTYWLAVASIAPAASFEGSGIAVTFDFEIANGPLPGEPDVLANISILSATLSDPSGSPIQHTTKNSTITIHSQQPYYNVPVLAVEPQEISGMAIGSNFTSSVTLASWNNVTNRLDDLSPILDVAGFELTFRFDPALVTAQSSTIDPDGWFRSFWLGGFFVVKNEINNVAGKIWIVFLGIPGFSGAHVPVSGMGRILKVSFLSASQSHVFPPPSCDLTLTNTTIAGFPHPERNYPPWNGSDLAPILPHTVRGSRFTALYVPGGKTIDIYTQYPDGYNGKGPNQSSDMFWPQKSVRLTAVVTFNSWPVQQKDVVFQLICPNGTTWAVFCNRTGSDGKCWVDVRLPWPCDNPESMFGRWSVVATVDIMCTVVNDTLVFKYDYRIHVWATLLDHESYRHEEYIEAEISYGTQSMQSFHAVFTVTTVDEVGVPFSCSYIALEIEGAQWCSWKNGTIKIECTRIPKFVVLGFGTVYVGVLNDLPSYGGSSLYPTREPETIVRFLVSEFYRVLVWETTLDREVYTHKDHVSVSVSLGGMSSKPFPVLVTAYVEDELGQPVALNLTWTDVGGGGFFMYVDQVVTMELSIPKFAVPGICTVYVVILEDGLPSEGGTVACPAKEPETIVHFILNP
jgi:hypothetical protein